MKYNPNCISESMQRIKMVWHRVVKDNFVDKGKSGEYKSKKWKDIVSKIRSFNITNWVNKLRWASAYIYKFLRITLQENLTIIHYKIYKQCRREFQLNTYSPSTTSIYKENGSSWRRCLKIVKNKIWAKYHKYFACYANKMSSCLISEHA